MIFNQRYSNDIKFTIINHINFYMNNIHTTSLNLILYTLLIICALSVPYSHFKDIKQKCDDTFEITGVTNGKCEYKMF